MSTQTSDHVTHAPVPAEREFPPILPVAVASLVLIVAGGVFMASYIPRKPPLTVPTILLSVSGLLMVANFFLLTRLHDFAWKRFVIVGRWSLLAYAISAGMIEFAFLKNHTKGGSLVVVSLMLLIFAVDVPLMIAFTVAKYERSGSESPGSA